MKLSVVGVSGVEKELAAMKGKDLLVVLTTLLVLAAIFFGYGLPMSNVLIYANQCMRHTMDTREDTAWEICLDKAERRYADDFWF